MSDSQWTDVVNKIDAMMGDATTGGNSSIWQAFMDGYDEDMSIVGLAEGGTLFGDRVLSNGDEVRTWINQAKDEASTAAHAFGDMWRTSIRPDVSMMNMMSTIADMWADDVATPVRNEPDEVRDSGLLETWSGPGAQAYATAVGVQSAAMAEMNTMTAGAGAQMKAGANLVKNIALLFLHSIQPVHDKLAGWPKHGYGDEHNSDMIFGERTAYGRAQFQGLQSWCSELVNGGEWKDQAADINTQLEDYKAKTQAFKDNTWPKATDGIDGKMTKGNSGLGNQSNPPGGTPGDTGATPPTTPAGTDPDPTSKDPVTVDKDGKVTGDPTTGPTGDSSYGGTGYSARTYGGVPGDTKGVDVDRGDGYSNVDN